MAPDIGTILRDRYRLDELLIKGRLGSIYRGTEIQKQQPISVKTFPITDVTKQDRLLAQIRGAFTSLSQLRHAGLFSALEVFVEQGAACLISEFEPGILLEAYVKEHGPTPEPQALAWMGQLCDVLQYLHGQDPPIIFRDLRPDNVMVHDGTRVRLLDFEISRVAEAADGRTVYRGIGASSYAAPEQLGTGRSGPHNDVYALGATLYFALTATVPPTPTDIMVGKAQLVRVRDVNPTVSDRFDDAVRKMMATRFVDRPASVPAARELLPATA